MGFLENQAEKSDEEILAISIKSPAVFEVLFDRYKKLIFSIAYNIVRQQEEAEDIVQETFSKIYSHASNFRKQEGASFKSWAARIAFNTSISHYRKLKKRGEREIALEQDHYENLSKKDHMVEALDATLITQKLLSRIPEESRHLIEAHYIKDKSYNTIAKEEEIPLSTLKMRMFRARKLLKDIIYDTL